MTFRKNLNGLAGGLALAVAGVVATAPVPAHAQFGGIVYDPSNYAQNVLTAARTLEQINNEIRMLQNQATSLINEARNLQSLPLNIVQPLQQQIQQTQQLLQQAQRIAYDVREIETTFETQYKNIPLGASQQAMVTSAEVRWQNSVAAFEDALKVQAGASRLPVPCKLRRPGTSCLHCKHASSPILPRPWRPWDERRHSTLPNVRRRRLRRASSYGAFWRRARAIFRPNRTDPPWIAKSSRAPVQPFL